MCVYWQHEVQRHKFYGALKSRADKKEGWVKLQREMVFIFLFCFLTKRRAGSSSSGKWCLSFFFFL
jgi:hypothetical protein